MQVLGGRGSTKGSNAKTAVNLSGEEHVGPLKPITMGLYVQGDNCTHLVALGNIYDKGFTIHSVAYANDVVRVSAKKIYDSDAEVPFSTSEIKYVR